MLHTYANDGRLSVRLRHTGLNEMGNTIVDIFNVSVGRGETEREREREEVRKNERENKEKREGGKNN